MIDGFTLIDTETNTPIGPLTEGMVLNTVTTPELGIQADVTGMATDVEFQLTDYETMRYLSRTDRSEPYTACGDTTSFDGVTNYQTCRKLHTAGTFTLHAVPFDGDHEGTGATISFSVIAGPGPARTLHGGSGYRGVSRSAVDSPAATSGPCLNGGTYISHPDYPAMHVYRCENGSHRIVAESNTVGGGHTYVHEAQACIASEEVTVFDYHRQQDVMHHVCTEYTTMLCDGEGYCVDAP